MAIYAQKVGSYQQQAVRNAIDNGLRALDIQLEGKRTAVIKPNLVHAGSPDHAVITHPVVVEALIDELQARGIERITIAERSAIEVDTMEAFEIAGYSSMARRKDVALADLSKLPRSKMQWKYGSLDVPQEILDADLYVSVPKMKTHCHATVTLSVKNQWGLLPPPVRQQGHQSGLHEALIELSKVIKPHLILVDGIEGMEGLGPTEGTKIHSRVLVMGDNMYETDVACCQLMGIDPHLPEHLQLAFEQGLWQGDPTFVGGEAPRVPRFALPPDGPRKMLNFYAWRNGRACSMAERVFEEAFQLALHNPRYWFTFMPKFIGHSVLGRLDYIRGVGAEPPDDHGAVLWVCDCSRQFISNNGTVVVPGCPPRPEDVLEAITRMPIQRAHR